MSTDATWKIQVSPKTQTGTLINVRGESEAEVKAGLIAVAQLAGEIATTEAMLAGAGAAASLVELPSAEVPAPVSVGGGAPPAYNPPAPATNGPSGPSCPHGARRFQSGVSKKTGKPYGRWDCPSGQCDVEWDRSYGK